jgi:hypothetical protein
LKGGGIGGIEEIADLLRRERLAEPLAPVGDICGIPASDMGLVMIDAIIELSGVEEWAIGGVDEDLGCKAGRSVFGAPVAGAGKNDGDGESAKASQYDPVLL